MLAAKNCVVWFMWKEGEDLHEARSVESKQATVLCLHAFAGHPEGQPGLVVAGIAAGESLCPPLWSCFYLTE